MRIHKAMTAAVFGIATAFLVTPSAMATPATQMSIGVMEKEVRAGQHITVVATCRIPGYLFEGSRVVSAALESAQELEPGRAMGTALAWVKPGVKPGVHALSFHCKGKKVTGTFEVLPDKKKTPVKKPAGQVTVKPKGAAETGGGGTA